MSAATPNPRFQAALERMDGDKELLRTMARIVVEDCPAQKLQQAVLDKSRS